MGCDIHFCVEKRVNGTWQRAEKLVPCKWRDNRALEHKVWYDGRNYNLFGLLAGVRERDIPAIGDPRGLPADTCIDPNDDEWPVGDHSRSWLGLRELLEYDWGQKGPDGLTHGEMVGVFYTETLPRLVALARQVGGAENVRIVFGFDS